jgi:hypothetical protein
VSDRAVTSTVEEGRAGTLGVRQAAFIGVGAMVGAGIFALLGAAGAAHARAARVTRSMRVPCGQATGPAA